MTVLSGKRLVQKNILIDQQTYNILILQIFGLPTPAFQCFKVEKSGFGVIGH